MTDQAAVEVIVKDILADKLNVDKNKIASQSDLANDLGMDSFGAIEVVFELEDKFDIKIPEEDIRKVKTVGDIVTYVSAAAKSIPRQ